jgi:hypothetical protein
MSHYHVSIGRIIPGGAARWASCDPIDTPPWLDDLEHACQLYADLLSTLRVLSRDEADTVFTIDLLRVDPDGPKEIYRRTLLAGQDAARGLAVL